MKIEKRDPIDFLKDILESIENIENFIEGFDFEKFSKDTKTIYAVVRALEIIGEATKNLPNSLKIEYPEVPWRDMAGFRDKVAMVILVLILKLFGVQQWKMLLL